MGFTSKRRGGSGDGPTGRSAKGAGSRVKDKYKDKADGDRSSTREDGGAGGRSRGGSSRSRIVPRASGGRSSSAESKGSDGGPARLRRKPIDLTLLTRGMSARPIGARVANQIRILSAEDIEKDLRHMEAYATACTTYAQQFFAYTNRDLVARGNYGPVPPLPGAAASDPHYGTNGAAPAYARNQGFDPVTGQFMSSHPSQTQQHAQSPRSFQTRDGRMISTGGPHAQHAPGGGFSMPVKIDPEEEKRLAQLRKKIAVSEAKREVLETEYLSLRAHYVHESQNVKKTRLAVNGQLELLKKLVKRRGEVLALRRARCAISRDILSCLEYRAKCTVSGVDTSKDEQVAKATDGGASEGMEGVEYTEGKKATPSEDEKSGNDGGKGAASGESTKDLMEIWKWIDSQLCEAERACTEIDTPADLLSVKPKERDGPSASTSGGSSGGVSPMKTSSSASASQSSSRRSKSPTRGKGSENDADGKDNGASRKKSGEKGSKSKRSSSDEGASSERDASKKNKDLMALYEDANVIPWQSQIMHRTPGGVPVYLSYLSSAPDKSGAFGTGGAFGSDSDSLCWLEANVPKLFQPEYSNDREDLFRLREEVQFLAEELEFERDNNKDLQRQVISTRKRSDEMCSMMSILRTETEAVLNRHNMILETPEAQAQAAEVHKTHAEGAGHLLGDEGESAIGDDDEDGVAKVKITADEGLSQDADIESSEEGDVQGGGIEFAAEEGEMQGDDEHSGDDEEEGIIYDEDDGGEVRVKEVIVRRTDEEEEGGEINEEDIGDDVEIPPEGGLPDDSGATGSKRAFEDGQVESPKNNGGFNSQKRRRRA